MELPFIRPLPVMSNDACVGEVRHEGVVWLNEETSPHITEPRCRIKTLLRQRAERRICGESAVVIVSPQRIPCPILEIRSKDRVKNPRFLSASERVMREGISFTRADWEVGHD